MKYIKAIKTLELDNRIWSKSCGINSTRSFDHESLRMISYTDAAFERNIVLLSQSGRTKLHTDLLTKQYLSHINHTDQDVYTFCTIIRRNCILRSIDDALAIHKELDSFLKHPVLCTHNENYQKFT